MRQWVAASKITVSMHANSMVAIVVVERESEQAGSFPTNAASGLTLDDLFLILGLLIDDPTCSTTNTVSSSSLLEEDDDESSADVRLTFVGILKNFAEHDNEQAIHIAEQRIMKYMCPLIEKGMEMPHSRTIRCQWHTMCHSGHMH